LEENTSNTSNASSSDTLMTPSTVSDDMGDLVLLIERKKKMALIKRETRHHIHRNVAPDTISKHLISSIKGIDVLLEECPRNNAKNLFILNTIKNNLMELHPKLPDEINKCHKELKYIYEYALLEDL
jgi:hypothetical protein